MGISQATLELLVNLKDNASAGLGSLGGAMGNVGMIAGGAALAGVVALGAAIVGGMGDAQEARALFAATEQVIKTTGGAAGMSAQQVTDLASALSDASGKSLFGDDQIQAAENILLTFTNIGKDVFPAATQATIDMAAALKTTPEAMDTLIGKALNTADGYKTLKKSGVEFTDSQAAQIDAMFAAGNAAGAQALILEELNKKYGGQAEAQAKAAGGLVQFKAGLGETFETIGGKLLPVLDKFGAWLNSPEVQANISIFADKLGRGIEVAADFLVNDLIPAITDLYNFLAPILGPIIAEVARALSEDLPRGIDRVVTAWNTMKQALSDFKVGYIDPIVRGWNEVTGAVSAAFAWFDKISASINGIQIPSWLQGHSPPPMAEWFDAIGMSAQNSSGAVGDFLSKLGSSAVSGIAGLFGGNTSGEPMQSLIGDILGQSSKGTVDLADLSSILSKQLPAGLADQISKIALGMSEGSGTAGAMGTMVRDLILANQDGNAALVNTIADAMLASTSPTGVGAQPPPSFGAAGAGAGGQIVVNVTVQGNVSTERDLVLAIRDGLNAIGRQNVTIFGGQT